MSDIIQDHEEAVVSAFAEVLQSEQAINDLKGELADTTARINMEVKDLELAIAEAWKMIGDLMKDTGETELILPGGDGSATDYKIAWSKPSARVNVPDVEALPDEFVKTEKKAKLKEIGDHFKSLIADDLPLPNWGSYEKGVAKLVWRTVKKSKS